MKLHEFIRKEDYERIKNLTKIDKERTYQSIHYEGTAYVIIGQRDDCPFYKLPTEEIIWPDKYSKEWDAIMSRLSVLYKQNQVRARQYLENEGLVLEEEQYISPGPIFALELDKINGELYKLDHTLERVGNHEKAIEIDLEAARVPVLTSNGFIFKLRQLR